MPENKPLLLDRLRADRQAWFRGLPDPLCEEAADEIVRLRRLLQDVVDDMTFTVAPGRGTMDKITEALRDAGG